MKTLSDETVETSLQIQGLVRRSGGSVSELVAVRFVGGRVVAVQEIPVMTAERLAELGKPLECD
jgi:hypothetical protein